MVSEVEMKDMCKAVRDDLVIKSVWDLEKDLKKKMETNPSVDQIMPDLKAKEKKKKVATKVEQASIEIQILRNRAKTLKEVWKAEKRKKSQLKDIIN